MRALHADKTGIYKACTVVSSQNISFINYLGELIGLVMCYYVTSSVMIFQES